jgi:hypothetical protein
MTSFRWDGKTGQFRMFGREKPTAISILAVVQRVHGSRIKQENITEDELLILINKVISGTRNINCLIDQKNPTRLREIGYTVLREANK